MNFTWNDYRNLINILQGNDYSICPYDNLDLNVDKYAILRHDVDMSMEKAVEMAVFEAELSVSSTYFFLISTGFYNVFSEQGRETIRQIKSLGHKIGLHFDETIYQYDSIDELQRIILTECAILSEVAGEEIVAVSMHRPSKLILESDLIIPGKINTYGSAFFKEIKYVSDSRMNWRENVQQYISENRFPKLQIVTHPIWYADKIESLQYKLKQFILKSKSERYDLLNNNFKDLESVLQKGDL